MNEPQHQFKRGVGIFDESRWGTISHEDHVCTFGVLLNSCFFVEWLIIWTSLRPARISNKCFFSGKLWSPRVGIKLLQLNKIMNECIWTHRKTCNLLTFSPRGTQNPVAISLEDSRTWLESLEGDPKSSFIKLLGRKTTNLNEVLFEFLRQALNPWMPRSSPNS